jgi:hypothetical protein
MVTPGVEQLAFAAPAPSPGSPGGRRTTAGQRDLVIASLLARPDR